MKVARHNVGIQPKVHANLKNCCLLQAAPFVRTLKRYRLQKYNRNIYSVSAGRTLTHFFTLVHAIVFIVINGLTRRWRR